MNGHATVRLILALLVTLAFAAPARSQTAQLPALVPPAQQVRLEAAPDLRIPERPTIAISSPELEAHAAAFAELWWRMTGVRPTVGPARSVTRSDFIFSLHPGGDWANDEAYEVGIGGGVLVQAGTPEGVARGSSTLLQLARRDDAGWSLPALVLRDAPDSPYRAVMVDVARQPHTIETLKSVVELMYLHRLRYLQLHLTDDQAFTFPFAPVTDGLPNNRTIPLERWVELVEFAAAHGIAIVPELDLPGHSSQLKASGYLVDPTPDTPLDDRDVAHPDNHARLFEIVDALNRVFTTSPYFHVGGDESGAGEGLVPFLAAVNTHLRTHEDPDLRRRLMVWEGFHGRPTELPATGDDRIVVMAWESSYNPPWNLLDAGYEVINASWKPLYVVGAGGPRYPHVGGRHWSERDLFAWNAHRFEHWQPGTPVFEDRGPGDDDRGDGTWTVPDHQRDQVLGGQLLFWEQREHTVLRDAWERVPALAERLWSGARPESSDFVGYRRRSDAVAERVRALVQPVRAVVRGGAVDRGHPTAADSVWFEGSTRVELTNTAGVAGEVRVSRDGSGPAADAPVVDGPLEIDAPGRLVAQLFVDGRAVGAPLRLDFDARPAKVWVDWFDLPRRALDHVPDFSDARRWRARRSDLLPELRGPYTTATPTGQRLRGIVEVSDAQAGTWEWRVQTRDGRARVFLGGAPLLGPSDPSEEKLVTSVELAAGPHELEVHHASGHIAPVVIVAVRPPGAERFTDVTEHLAPIGRTTEPERLGPLRGEIDLVAAGPSAWHFWSRDGSTLAEVAEFTDVGTIVLPGSPQGYLATKQWFTDYEVELEWRWPEGRGGGNSGVLVHVTTPQLFYGWPRSLEVQLAAENAGDFWVIGDDVDVTVEDDAVRRRTRRPGDLHGHRRIPGRLDGLEREPGEWNHMRVRCDGDEIVVHVNGVEVNRGIDCTVHEGAFALQSEGRRIEFRRVVVRELERRWP